MVAAIQLPGHLPYRLAFPGNSSSPSSAPVSSCHSLVGDHATAHTAARCPLSVCVKPPETMSHSITCRQLGRAEAGQEELRCTGGEALSAMLAGVLAEGSAEGRLGCRRARKAGRHGGCGTSSPALRALAWARCRFRSLPPPSARKPRVLKLRA